MNYPKSLKEQLLTTLQFAMNCHYSSKNCTAVLLASCNMTMPLVKGSFTRGMCLELPLPDDQDLFTVYDEA